MYVEQTDSIFSDKSRAKTHKNLTMKSWNIWKLLNTFPLDILFNELPDYILCPIFNIQ